MSHCACLFLVSVAAHLFCIDAHRVSVTSEAKIPNDDQLTCIRQDNLDLIKPRKPGHVVRQTIAVDAVQTGSDIIVSIDEVWIKTLSLTVKIKRKPDSDTFTFDVMGDTPAMIDGVQYYDLASVDFWLSGVDCLIADSWLEYGASWVADRDLLDAGQDGTMRFKMSGEGRGVFNTVSGQWEIVMVDEWTDTKPFEMKIENQWILEKAVKRYGGIEQKILDNLWPTVAKIFPVSLASTFRYMSSTELDMGIDVKISGSQADMNAPLVLQVNRRTVLDSEIPLFSLDALPWRLLQEFSTNFDPATIAARQVRAMLEEQNMEQMWEENKPVVKATLRRYGVATDWMEGELDIEEIEKRLIESAKKGADFMLQAMKPFIEASQHGQEKIFEGVSLELFTKIDWSKNVDDGRIKVHINAPAGEESHFFVVPKTFIEAVGGGDSPTKLLVPPKTGRTTIGHSDLTLQGRELVCGRADMENMLVRLGGVNGSKVNIWKLGGAVKDVTITMPDTLDLGWDFAWHRSHVELKEDGTIIVGGGHGGMDLEQKPRSGLPPAPQQWGKLRPVTTPVLPATTPPTFINTELFIDGHVPPEIARPTRDKEEVALTDKIPMVSLTATLSLTGNGDRLQLGLLSTGTVHVNMERILRPTLAVRPTEDFGYTFHAGMFTRFLKNPEPTAVRFEATQMAVVVSCGFLRLLEAGKMQDPSDPFAMINFKPEVTGQLEIDLKDYLKVGLKGPEVSETWEGTDHYKCIDLYTNILLETGHKMRFRYNGAFKITRYDEVSEKLCGEAKEVDKLMYAIKLQLARWGHDPDKAVKWNHGTHPMQTEDLKEKVPQFALNAGQETHPLTDILSALYS